MTDRHLPKHTSTGIAKETREWLVPAESTSLGLRHPVVWSVPGRAVMIQRVEPGPLTADEADRLGDALHAAAAYVRQETPDA
ncbi:hypothetical protein [Corynebacterium glyciniphilum]|uniref:hypothetical protein n=1 Tax=Corynebacterium glyciniphilum TaxID=1404244 RepID=UPI003FCFAEDD